LLRLALKLATGAGKTTVMAMIIAWQIINAVRRPNSKKFTRGFLIVAPDLMGMKNILAINDKAHHCYREKPLDVDDENLSLIA